MVRNLLMRRGGFLVLSASILVLLLATAGLADKTLPPETLPDGSTRVTTTDDAGETKKTVDTSKTSADGVQTVTTTEYAPGVPKGQPPTVKSFEKKELKKGKLISEQGESGGEKWHYKYNEYGQETYESEELWRKGKLEAGHHTTSVFLDPKDKEPSVKTTEYYQPDTQTWGPERPKKAEEKPKTPETPGGAKTRNTSFFFRADGGIGFGTNQTASLSSFDSFTRRERITNYSTNFTSQGHLDLGGTFGFTLGTWFDYECCGYRLTFRYFGFSLNYSYYSLEYSSHGGEYSKAFLSRQLENNFFQGDSTFRSDGSVHSVGFLLNARYPFLPNDEMPFGRVQPWIAFGPTINIVTQKPTEKLDNIRIRNGENNFDYLNIYQKFNSQTAVMPGVQFNVGVDYFIKPWLSFGPSLQYNHFRFSENLTGPGDLRGSFSIPVNNFNIKMGMTYIF